VQYLPHWYAQSHPSEDFAETFAVWLDPASRWQSVYRQWPALEKLLFVDDVMGRLRGKPPKRISSRTHEPLDSLRHTLRQHYSAKRGHYQDAKHCLDSVLHREFSGGAGASISAAQSIAEARQDILSLARERSDFDKYSLTQGINGLLMRASYLKLSGRKQLSQRSCRELADLVVKFVQRLAARRDALVR
jgi:hypothetical protein